MKRFFLSIFCAFVSALFCSAQTRIEMGRGEDKQAIGLHSLKVETEVIGPVLIHRYKMEFFNDVSQNWAEGEMFCPLPEGAKITYFAMDVNGVKREGVVAPATQAVNAYEDIVRRKIDPGLVEIDEKNHFFRVRVFPVPAQKVKTVWLTTMQLIDEGEVTLAYDQFGKVGSYAVTLTVSDIDHAPKAVGWEFKRNGQDEKSWNASQSGKLSIPPSCKIEVKPKPVVLSHSIDGKQYCTSIQPYTPHYGKKYEDVTQLWWDGTIEPEFGVLEQLSKWMQWKGEGEIELTVFRDTLEKVERFKIEGGKCDVLLQRLSKEKAFGVARPVLLPWDKKHHGVILVSDGQFPEGDRFIEQRDNYPFFPIFTEGHENACLTSESIESLAENGFSNIAHLEKGMMVVGNWQIQSGVAGEQRDDLLESQAAYWMWAQSRSIKLDSMGYDQRAISKFHTRHGVANSDYAWIVLESVHQHIVYDIEPPKSELELYEKWVHSQEAKTVKEKRKLNVLSKVWSDRCAEQLQVREPFKKLGHKVLNNKVTEWVSLHDKIVTVPDADLKEMTKLLNESSDKEISEKAMYDLLLKQRQIDKRLLKKLKMITVLIGGQVDNPGPYTMKAGTTLHEAVNKASPNAFAATNRVKLTRKGKNYTYDLRNIKLRGVRIFSNDIITVPQKQWFGNGGGDGVKKAPFEQDRLSSKLLVKDAKWDEKKPYVRSLHTLMHQKGQWRVQYEQLKKIYGWRADFYLDVIELMEKSNERKFAIRVAQELAELHPDNAEILRRSARALRRLGEKELSHALFHRVQMLTPESDISYYDYGRSLIANGQQVEGCRNLWKALMLCPHTHAEGRSIIYLEELNAALVMHQIKPEQIGLPVSLVQHVPLDFRVVMHWDAKKANVDLSVTNPLLGQQAGVKFSARTNADDNRILWSGNVSRGLGPESCSVAHALPGNYEIHGHFWGDWNHDERSTVTVDVEFITNFGRKGEKREWISIRLPEGKQQLIATKDVPLEK